MRKLLVLMGVIVATIGGVTAPAMATPPTCGAVITESTTLTADLLGCTGDGLVIAADEVTLDLGGYTLGAAPGNAGIGIQLTGHKDVTITNGSIIGFWTGITVTDARRLTVQDVTVNSRENGAQFVNVRGSHILSSSIAGVTRLITMVGSDNNEIIDTSGLGDADTQVGVRLEDSHGNLIRNGSFRRSDGPNIVLIDSDDNVVEDTDAGGSNTVGIQLIRADDNRIRRNFTDSESGSVNLASSNWNQIVGDNGGESVLGVVESANNRFRGNVAGALTVFRSANTTAIGNVFLDDFRGDGVVVDAASTGTLLVRNRAHEFDDDGFDIDAVDTYLQDNRANHNGDLGIEAVTGVVDLGGNRAFENGNALQCTGVACNNLG